MDEEGYASKGIKFESALGSDATVDRACGFVRCAQERLSRAKRCARFEEAMVASWYEAETAAWRLSSCRTKQSSSHITS